MTEKVTMSISDCKPPKYLDVTTMTSNLNTVSNPKSSMVITRDCSQGVQIMNHPPISIKPVFRAPSNRFREEVMRKYPFLFNKDSLYDKKEKILRDPSDPMLSTYTRDYGCLPGAIELVRSHGREPPMPDTTVRYPHLAYKPGTWSPISKELRKLYTLPGGGWALNRPKLRSKPITTQDPTHKRPPKMKWESEYQANIDGIANYMKEIGALKRKGVYVRRIPTLPD